MQPCLEPVAFLTPSYTRAGKGGKQRAQQAPRQGEPGRAAASTLRRSLHPFFPRLGLKRLKERGQGTSPTPGSLFQKRMFFPARRLAALPRLPCASPSCRLASHTPSMPRGDFPRGQQLGPKPIAVRRRKTFLGAPTRFAQPLPPLRGASTARGGGHSGKPRSPHCRPPRRDGVFRRSRELRFPGGKTEGTPKERRGPPRSGEPARLRRGEARPAPPRPPCWCPSEPSARRSPAGSPPPLLRAAPPATGTFSNFSLPGKRRAAASALSRGAGPGELPAGGPEGAGSLPFPTRPPALPRGVLGPPPFPPLSVRRSSRCLRPP